EHHFDDVLARIFDLSAATGLREIRNPNVPKVPEPSTKCAEFIRFNTEYPRERGFDMAVPVRLCHCPTPASVPTCSMRLHRMSILTLSPFRPAGAHPPANVW